MSELLYSDGLRSTPEKAALMDAKIELFNHGKSVFGSLDLFIRWLHSDNFYFDKKPPAEMLSTLEGIKFIDDRLTGMQYGDNA